MSNLTLISWAVAGPQLAIGNAKGDLVIYNKKELKKQLIRGKHTKKITCGAWNSENKLALGSEDPQVTPGRRPCAAISRVGMDAEREVRGLRATSLRQLAAPTHSRSAPPQVAA